MSNPHTSRPSVPDTLDFSCGSPLQLPFQRCPDQFRCEGWWPYLDVWRESRFGLVTDDSPTWADVFARAATGFAHVFGEYFSLSLRRVASRLVLPADQPNWQLRGLRP